MFRRTSLRELEPIEEIFPNQAYLVDQPYDL